MNKLILSLLAITTMSSLTLPVDATIPIEKPENSLYIADSAFGLTQSMPYEKARQILINQGWQAQIPISLGGYPNLENPTIKYLFSEKGYQEVEDCSGTGLGLCRFKFRNATGETLIVVTANNQPGQKVTVFSWFLE